MYRVKTTDAGETADQNIEGQRPQTTRARRAPAKTQDGEEVEETKQPRARSTRRRRKNSLSAVIDGDDADDAGKGAQRTTSKRPQNRDGMGAATENSKSGGKSQVPKKLSAEEKAKRDLEKKREKMSNQYEPYVKKKVFTSRYSEYRFAEWAKKRNNLFVTIETVVPPMPKKPLEEPDDAKYHLEVARIDEQIEKLQEDFKELIAEKH